MKKMIMAVLMAGTIWGFAQNAEIVKVRGKGVGVNRAEALKDAYRDAVEQAVGMFVDAEQLLKNDELVKDQILTHSNAYVLDCRELEEKQIGGGLVQLRILATVKKTALTKKLSGVMPTQTIALNTGLQNVHAQLVTKESRAKDAAALLKNALEGFDPLVLVADCSLASPEAVIREERAPYEQKNTIAVNYLFRSGINQLRFFENVVPRLKDVLAQISLAEPRAITIPVRIGEAIDVDALVERRKKSPNFAGGGERLRGSLPKLSFDPKSSDTAGFFILVVSGNKYRTSFNGIVYELDEASAKVASNWQLRIGKKKEKANFNVSMVDASGEILFSRAMNPWINGYTPNVVTRKKSMGRFRNIYAVMVAPWDWERGTFEECCWKEFLIPKDVLPEIKSMKVEIVQ